MLTARFLCAPAVLPPISTQGLSSEDVGQLAQDVRESMVTTLKEISAPPPAASVTEVDDDEDEDSETVPLAKGKKETSTKSAGYGTGELRRRTSAGDTPGNKQSKVDKKEVAETGALDGQGGVMAGALDAVKGETAGQKRAGEEEEESDDGAVLVARPEE